VRRTICEPEHEHFREVVRSFLSREAVPYAEDWESRGEVPRAFWEQAASHGLVGFEAPDSFGGAGLRDFRFNAVIDEEVAYTGAVGDNFTMQNDIIAPYLVDLANEQQRARWLPDFTAGRLIAALAMTEPGAGSDVQAIATRARPDGDGYIVDGTKTFVTSGIQADIVIVAAKTTPEGGKGGISLLVVERGMEGFERGRKLEKSGRWAHDTAELFFNEVRVPAANLLGERDRGFQALMSNLSRERISMAISAVAASERALEITLEYAKERKAFGQPIGSFQANRFALAELFTEVTAARAYVDRCIEGLVAGELTPAESAGAKAWTTELQGRVVDRCVQLHGGYGYMREYEISRLWRDARVQRIYGGTTEIMLEIVGRSLGL
jgi:acyl-CoA dehydrogenase